MRFVSIREGINPDIQQRVNLLKQACLKREVEFIDLNALDYDYSQISNFGKDTLLYKIGRGAFRLESLLLNDNVTTFYKVNPKIWFLSCTSHLSIIHEKIGLSQPKTVHHGTNNPELLKKYADYLKGFPIIIKVAGGSRGLGVMKADSFKSLVSITDYLVKTNTDFILREYIKSTKVGRIFVLGNKVVASLEQYIPENDFRSNSQDKLVYKNADFSDNANELAINSVCSVGVEFGGVDIIFDENNKPYLLEMNFPSGFISVEKICNVDIAGLMVDYLIQKAKS